MGIAALGSSIMQLTVRDTWIGWHGDKFLKHLEANASDAWAKWVENALMEQIGAIYLKDFIQWGTLSDEDLVNPREDAIGRLRELGAKAREQHQRFPKASEHKSVVRHDAEWEQKALSHLFRAKRAMTLADLLETKLRLMTAGFGQPTQKNLRNVLQDRHGRAAVKGIVRHVKAAHVGINMMDITVCGAIHPYNPILGGKLVSLLMASPEIMMIYEDRYLDSSSVIASSMAGRGVRRTPQLVMLGTTSLYGVGSSQYNRLRMPAIEVGGASEDEIRYYELGHTLGYGSFQLSGETLDEFEAFWAQGHGGAARP